MSVPIGAEGEAGDAGNSGTSGTAGTTGSGDVGGSSSGGGATGGQGTVPPPGDVGEPISLTCSVPPCAARFEYRQLMLWFADLSGNGQVVVGQDYDGGLAFRLDWVTNELSYSTGENADFKPEATNRTGDTIVGNDWASFNVPIKQSGADAAVRIPGLELGFWANGISEDGNVIAASSPAGSVLLRGEDPTSVPAELRAVSGNGEVAGGFRLVDELTKRAVLWSDGELFDLPDASDGTPTEVLALNADGTVAVGTALRFDQAGYEQHAFRWVEGEGTTLLDGPESQWESYATDCDASGDIVVGHTWTPERDGVFYYTKLDGMVSLRHKLEGIAVPVPETFHFESGSWPRLSSDGTRIAGNGFVRSASGPEGLFLWHVTIGADASRPR